ncbi:hypothetical protein BH09MYX1_BH09MYX1_32610 [soil metagenome]
MHTARFIGLALVMTAIACREEAKPTTVPAPALSAPPIGSSALPTAPPIVEPAEVVVSASAISVRGVDVMDLPVDGSHGADAKYKRSGPNDLYLVPLAEAYPGLDAGRTARTIGIDFDDSTPYRVVIEVLVTLGQRDFEHWEIRRRGHAEMLTITPPRFSTQSTGIAQPGLSLSLLLVDGGMALKTAGGNVAPGCKGGGAGIAVPKRDNEPDYVALASCLHALKVLNQREHTMTLSASPAIPFSEVWVALAVAIGDKHDLFPDVQFAISR